MSLLCVCAEKRCFPEIAYSTFKIKSTSFDTVLPGNTILCIIYWISFHVTWTYPSSPSGLQSLAPSEGALDPPCRCVWSIWWSCVKPGGLSEWRNTPPRRWENQRHTQIRIRFIISKDVPVSLQMISCGCELTQRWCLLSWSKLEWHWRWWRSHTSRWWPPLFSWTSPSALPTPDEHLQNIYML